MNQEARQMFIFVIMSCAPFNYEFSASVSHHAALPLLCV